jgi:hypothetical protein
LKIFISVISEILSQFVAENLLLLWRCFAAVSPLLCRYFAAALPLFRRCFAAVSPLLCRCFAAALPRFPLYQFQTHFLCVSID